MLCYGLTRSGIDGNKGPAFKIGDFQIQRFFDRVREDPEPGMNTFRRRRGYIPGNQNIHIKFPGEEAPIRYGEPKYVRTCICYAY